VKEKKSEGVQKVSENGVEWPEWIPKHGRPRTGEVTTKKKNRLEEKIGRATGPDTNWGERFSDLIWKQRVWFSGARE